jgi:hypothetical protein
VAEAPQPPPVPAQQAIVDPNLQAVLEHFAKAKVKAADDRKLSQPVAWLRPPETASWNGGLLVDSDVVNIHQAFQTDEAENALISAFSPQEPGNTGDGVVLPLQIDYMMQAERAYRARTVQSFPRAVAHTIGRETGHGQANGVFLGQALRYFTTLIKQGAG